MAVSDSKFLGTQNPFSVILIIISFLLLMNNNVKSDTISFNVPSFQPDDRTIVLVGDASSSNGVLQLTKKDGNGNPVQSSVGIAIYFQSLEMNNKSSGRFADFTTEFSFIVDRKGAKAYGDGMTFFIASTDFKFPPTTQSAGGFLGLFNSETAMDPSKNQVVAVEFDSFANEWDPNAGFQRPHVGFDINSIKSVATAVWLSEFEADGTVGKASISYDSRTKHLSVSVTYPDDNRPVSGDVRFGYPVDLSSVLSEQVLIGFTAATGDTVETHDILSWSFSSSL